MSHSDFQPLWRAYPPGSMPLGAPPPNGSLLQANFPDPMMHPINGQHVWADHLLPVQAQLASPPGIPPFPPIPPAPSFGVQLTDSIIVPSASTPKYLRVEQCLEFFQCGKSKFYGWMNPRSKFYDPTFPRRIYLGKGRIPYWKEHELIAWAERQAWPHGGGMLGATGKI